MPNPKILNDATPRRSSRSLRSCKLLTATSGSCSVSDCAILSSPNPQERQKFCPSAFLFPQLGQYIRRVSAMAAQSLYVPPLTCVSQKQIAGAANYLMLTVIEYVLLRASASMMIV